MRSATASVIIFMFIVSAAVSGSELGKESQVNPGLTTAVIERTLTYQGILKDNSGNPVGDGNYNLTFRIYDAAASGTLLWTSPVTPIATSDGYFSAIIGPIQLPFDVIYFLSIQVQGDSEMGQRQKITLSPYSAVTDTANYAFAAPGDGSNWNLSTNNVLYTNDYWGIAKGNAGNTVRGDSARTMVNLGCDSYTGTFGNQVYNTIGGGSHNRASMSFSTVAGGQGNTAMAQGSAVVGGLANSADSSYSFIGGGWHNYAGATCAVVAGGYCDTASGSYDFIGGGSNNIATGSHSTIAGGSNSYAGTNSTIGGGIVNTADDGGTIAGGNSNVATAFYSTIGGGQRNDALESYSAVGGGNRNSAYGYASAILGGILNRVDDTCSVIGGGRGNRLYGKFSAIPGGYADTLESTADYSMAFGKAVYGVVSYRFYLFNSEYPGRLSLNRDTHSGGASYPIHVGAEPSNGNGAYLTNAGVWTNASSRTFKENFTPFNGAELLSKIAGLSITTYNYINTTEKHFGPVAEEFVGAFDTGVIREHDGKRDDMYLSSGDVAGVALAGVQELLKQNLELKNENIELKNKMADFERRLAELENR